MRLGNDIFLEYLGTAFSACVASLVKTDGMMSAGPEVEFGHRLQAYRTELTKRSRIFEEIIKARGGNRPSGSIEGLPQFGPASAASSGNVFERTVFDTVGILQSEQAQLALLIGLAEMSRVLDDSKSEGRLIDLMTASSKEIERFQKRLPTAIRSAFAAVDVLKSA
ncbi:MAG: hypothetical protein ACYC1U_05705 [Candidatus Aquicultorales bacterium]